MKNTGKRRYTIEVSERQLALLETACEFTARFSCGQIESSVWPSFAKARQPLDYTLQETDAILSEVSSCLNRVKKLWFGFERNQHGGVGHSQEGDILWDIYQVLRKKRYDDMDDDRRELMSHTVISHEPMKFGTEGLAKVKDHSDYESFALHIKEYGNNGIPVDHSDLVRIAQMYNCEVPRFVNGEYVFSNGGTIK
jgi:hypothetical protein